jgi:hypothetical protein
VHVDNTTPLNMANEADRATLRERWDKVTIGSCDLMAHASNDDEKASFVLAHFKASALTACMHRCDVRWVRCSAMGWHVYLRGTLPISPAELMSYSTPRNCMQDCAQEGCPEGDVVNAVCLWHATWTPDGSKVKELVVFGGPYSNVKVLFDVDKLAHCVAM